MTPTYNVGDRVVYIPAENDLVEVVERVDRDGHLLTRLGPREYRYAPDAATRSEQVRWRSNPRPAAQIRAPLLRLSNQSAVSVKDWGSSGCPHSRSLLNGGPRPPLPFPEIRARA
jgi:hypothetical protein